jgi:hypothetical protein
METDTIDTSTSSPSYIFKERRALRGGSHEQRENRFALANLTSKSFALKQTCRQVRNEVVAFAVNPSFQFNSIEIFCAFLGNHNRWEGQIDRSRVEVLLSASKVFVMVNKDEWPGLRLLSLTSLIDAALAVHFVDEKGDAGRELSFAVRIWKEFVEND